MARYWSDGYKEIDTVGQAAPYEVTVADAVRWNAKQDPLFYDKRATVGSENLLTSGVIAVEFQEMRQYVQEEGGKAIYIEILVDSVTKEYGYKSDNFEKVAAAFEKGKTIILHVLDTNEYAYLQTATKDYFKFILFGKNDVNAFQIFHLYSNGLIANSFINIPVLYEWALQRQKPTYTYSDVGADKDGAARDTVRAHNTSGQAHSDLRVWIQQLQDRINTVANSDDVSLDQLAELVAYIKDNRELIAQITTDKVSVSSIIDNLSTSDATRPLSAQQGVVLNARISEEVKALKSLIAALEPSGAGVITQLEKGAPGGVAALDASGKVPKEQLPELGEKYGVGGEELGLVKNGGNVTINPDGSMNAPTSGAVQSDWNAIDINEGAIKNKPPIENGSGEKSIGFSDGVAIGKSSTAEGKAMSIGEHSHAEGVGFRASDIVSAYADITEVTDTTLVASSLELTQCLDKITNDFKEDIDSFSFIILLNNETYYPIQSFKKKSSGTIELTVEGGYSFPSDLTNYKLVDVLLGVSYGDSSHSENDRTLAIGDYSHTEGVFTKAVGMSSHAEGRFTKAVGEASHTEGYNTEAPGTCSHAEGAITNSTGLYSHAEGLETNAIGSASHAEGRLTTAHKTCSHAEGHGTKAYGYASHAEGTDTMAMGDYSHAEGNNTIAEGSYSHAEGQSTHAEGNNSHAEGWETKALGERAHAEGYNTEASANQSHAEGNGTKAIGKQAHAEGTGTTAEGSHSHAEGQSTKATANNSHAEGLYCESNGYASHAEGFTSTTQGEASHAEGFECNAIGMASHAEGYNTEAGLGGDDLGIVVFASHAEGYKTKAQAPHSHAEGHGTITGSGAFYQHVQGKYNIVEDDGDFLHIIGNGTKENPSNIHTVDYKGNGSFKGSVKSNGADYAEYFEWQDGNPNNEDRVGLLVALDEDKIRLANNDDEILGIISGTVAVLGDNYEWEWNGKYLTDDFGRVLYDLVEEFVDAIVDINEETNEPIIEKKSLGIFKHPKLNPNYDPTQKYINRSERPEWSAVGMIGKLYVRDDGTCKVNGYVTVGEKGIATASTEKTNMRVLSRVADNVIRVLLK